MDQHQEKGEGKKNTEKKKENVTRQMEEKNKGGCLRCLGICMYKFLFSI